MKEEWREFAGGNYEVSSLGNVRRKTPGRKTYPGRPVVKHKVKVGYYMIGPTINGRNVNTYVHKLVAEVFIGPCPSGCEVNHIDGDKTNNRADNLEYVTHGENMRHARRNGMIKDRCRLTNDDVRNVHNLRASGLSYSQIARKAGVSIGHAWSIVNGAKRKDIVP